MGRTVSKMAVDSELAQAAKKRLPENVWEEVNKVLSHNDIKKYLTSDGALKLIKDIAKKLLPGVWGVLSGAANVLTFFTGLLIIMLLWIMVIDIFQSA